MNNLTEITICMVLYDESEEIILKTLEKINLESNSNFFDIIIDDGSHYLSDILFSLKTLFEYVKNTYSNFN